MGECHDDVRFLNIPKKSYNKRPKSEPFRPRAEDDAISSPSSVEIVADGFTSSKARDAKGRRHQKRQHIPVSAITPTSATIFLEHPWTSLNILEHLEAPIETPPARVWGSWLSAMLCANTPRTSSTSSMGHTARESRDRLVNTLTSAKTRFDVTTELQWTKTERTVK